LCSASCTCFRSFAWSSSLPLACRAPGPQLLLLLDAAVGLDTSVGQELTSSGAAEEEEAAAPVLAGPLPAELELSAVGVRLSLPEAVEAAPEATALPLVFVLPFSFGAALVRSAASAMAASFVSDAGTTYLVGFLLLSSLGAWRAEPPPPEPPPPEPIGNSSRLFQFFVRLLPSPLPWPAPGPHEAAKESSS